MDDIRDQILDAALRLLEQDSSPAMGAIAKAAGVSRATLYRRFASAEELWAAVDAERAARAVPGSPRERLLAAARAAFGRGGLHGTSVQQLAAEARVGLATLYNQFGDKQGLLLALIDAIDLRGLEAAASAARLEALVEALVRAARADAGLLQLLLSPEPALASAQARLRQRLAPIEAALAALAPDPSARLAIIAQAAAAGAWGAEPPAAAASRIVGVGGDNGGAAGARGGRR